MFEEAPISFAAPGPPQRWASLRSAPTYNGVPVRRLGWIRSCSGRSPTASNQRCAGTAVTSVGLRCAQRQPTRVRRALTRHADASLLLRLVAGRLLADRVLLLVLGRHRHHVHVL